MTLRARLLVASLAIVVPLSAVLFAVAERVRAADMADRLDQFARAEVASGVRDRCLATDGLFPRLGPEGALGPGRGGPAGRGGLPPDDPLGLAPAGRGLGPRGAGAGPAGRAGAGGRGGDGPPYQLSSFDDTFAPPRVSLPSFPEALKAPLASADQATQNYTDADGRGIERALRLSHDAGPCAILLIRMPARPGERRDQLIAIALILISVIVAVWAAAGPVISRLRRLGADVHVSADSMYATPVAVSGRDEVADVAAAFNDAGRRVRRHLQDIEAREAALRDFVANTAHDVGVPLTVLQGHLADIAAHATDAAAVQGAIREAHYLSSLIRNLNAATTLDTRGVPLVMDRVDLGALVERVSARHQPIARSSRVSLAHAVPDTPVFVTADVTLLEQAVSNLVDNAIRYNRAGGHVAIVLDRPSASAPTSDAFVLTVADDGPGVSAAELARLSDRRFRSDAARTRRPDGQGLGLAIATEALARMDLALQFSHVAEGGLCATIRSPRMR